MTHILKAYRRNQATREIDPCLPSNVTGRCSSGARSERPGTLQPWLDRARIRPEASP
jgi:hypothetical protein